MKIIEVEFVEDIPSKESELASKVNTYKLAQIYQLENGGPGPVADYETMEIVNHHNGEFSVILKENSTEES